MSSPSPADRRFLDGRRMRTHVGLYLLPVALCALLSTWVGLFAWWPLAINPMQAAVHFEGEQVVKGTLTQYAIVVTILVNVLLLVASVAITFGILWARSERRYLRLLSGWPERQAEPAQTPVLAKKTAETAR